MIKKMFIVTVLAIGLLASSCSNDDDNNVPSTASLTLELDGLEALGSGYVYEGWIIVNGAPVSTGTFSSVSFPQSFTVDATLLKNATDFVLSIEPAGETGVEAATPAETKLLAGGFSGNTANVSTGIVGDFSNATGKYILATPTDSDDTNESSGVWFLDNTNAPPPVAGLDLPTLGAGWKYEGWAVINGTPISTGTFTKVAATDDAAPFSGNVALPTPNGADGFFPGEDFLENAPNGVTFPTDLKGATIVISIEPSPDDNAAPFTLKPLAHVVPDDAADHTVISMGTGPVVALSGKVSR
ncbi:anti-sigma factor [Flavivirga rizhaonensis]|uniref:Anti-sigma factor n=1 Tax=Flavivirga rizhaonensis TaxID=2559571 RepID=A0A4S1DXI8_9FLAO|nr:anti-sigma factor [Flavivirga rizhaonensis]TGV02981.1 anti-sigma factor [Flavivirga rizhaonensis]